MTLMGNWLFATPDTRDFGLLDDKRNLKGPVTSHTNYYMRNRSDGPK